MVSGVEISVELTFSGRGLGEMNFSSTNVVENGEDGDKTCSST